MKELKELRKETIKKLEELKETISKNNTETNYCNIINTLIEYDNNAQDNLYLYDNSKEIVDIIDNELLQYYLEEQLKNNGAYSLYYIFNELEHPDDLYKLNVYGNLENVTDGDFINIIDDAIDTLKLKEGVEE